MQDSTLITAGSALAVGIIGWFLKGMINDFKFELKALEDKVNTNSTRIEVLSSNHANIEKNIDGIFNEIKLLRQDIKEKKHE